MQSAIENRVHCSDSIGVYASSFANAYIIYYLLNLTPNIFYHNRLSPPLAHRSHCCRLKNHNHITFNHAAQTPIKNQSQKYPPRQLPIE